MHIALYVHVYRNSQNFGFAQSGEYSNIWHALEVDEINYNVHVDKLLMCVLVVGL